jgi:uncharacterized protein (TIGR02099 family)
MNDSPPLPSALLKVYAACAKWSLWLLASAWLLLALAWGALHWWIVPRIGDLRPQLEAHASRALGVPVRIGSVSARSAGLLPALELHSVVLLDPQGREALRLPQVVAAPSPRSLWKLGFEQLYIERPELDVRRLADGRILVAGLELGRDPQGEDGTGADWFFSQREFLIRGGSVRWTDEKAGTPPLALTEVDLLVRNTSRRHALRLDATPPVEWGDRFTVTGQFRRPLLSTQAGRWQEWDGQVHADFARVDLRELRRYAQAQWQVDSGHGALRAWIDVQAGRPTGGAVDLSVAQVSTRLAASLPPLELDWLSGRLAGKHRPEGFEIEARQLAFTTTDGHRWPTANLFVGWSADAGQASSGSGELRADRLDLGTLRQLGGRLPLSEAAHAALARFAPDGLVENLQARWQGEPQAPRKYSAKGRVSGLQIAAGAPQELPGGRLGAGTPGVRNAAIDFDLTETGGRAHLVLDRGALELPGVFEDPVLAFDRLSTDLQWQLAGERISVSANRLRFANADAEGEGQASWRTGDDAAHRFPGVLDLQGSLARANGTRVWRYLPLAVPRPARDYVRQAVQQGDVSDGRFRVKGPLHEFPFVQGQGEFRVSAQVRNATFAYIPKGIAQPGQPPWPALTQLAGRLVFDRGGMRVEDAAGRFGTASGLRFRADAEIPDLGHTVVGVTAEVRGPLGEALTVVQRSPISALLQDALGKAVGTGPTDLRLKLALPIAQIERSTVLGTVTLAGNDVQVSPDSPVLSRARGAVTFSEKGFSLSGVQARALGGDVRLEGGTRTGASEAAVVLRAQGTATAEGLRQARELGLVAQLARHASGSATYVAHVAFRRGTPEVQVSSSLQGLALDLPAPLAKAADTALPLRYENTLLRDTSGALTHTDQLVVELGRAASVHYVRDTAGPQPRVLRGAIAVGLPPGETAVLPDQGVAANVQLGAADVDAWEKVLDGAAAPAGPSPPRAPPASAAASLGYMPTVFAVRARELTVEGRTLHNLVVGGSRDGPLWRGNIDAEELNGYIEYRQPLRGGAGRVTARLARLSIAGASASAVETLLDEQPSNIPALDVVVDDFELRGRKLGRLEIDAVNRGSPREGSAREWRLNKLSLGMPEATFSATGNWAAVEAQAVPTAAARPARVLERRRTVMNFRLDIGDAGQLLGRVGMKDVVRGGRGRMEGQVAWLGSPLSLDYPSMTGSFHVNVESGQFLKADPGLAKLLGVLSLQALPRRLALDFRDVFSQGFPFDFVRGDVTIQQGVAATNNLQMKGVNAAVAMEGRADLARETQDLRVVVVPEINAGTASLVAAAINPAIGLGTFLAQMFLREPLARATTQQFQIDGTWADPRVTRVPRQGAGETPKADAGAPGTRAAGSN